MNKEMATVRTEKIKEKQRSDSYYKQLYEEEKLKNENLHHALMDLRKKCEKWYNSAEMEEELIVNKLMVRLDELKGHHDPITLPSPSAKSLDSDNSESVDHKPSVEELQATIDKLRAELDDKEKDLEILRLQIKAMHNNHTIAVKLSSLSEDLEEE